MEKYSVQLIDDETATSYTINLTQEEYDKAATDRGFLHSILTGIKDGSIPSISPQQACQQGSTNKKENATNNTVGVANITGVEEPTDSWTTEATLNFITEYEILQEIIDRGKVKQKDAFEPISSNLRKNNIFVNAKQCSTKLASLKRTYKKIKDHNHKSGNDRQTWQYFERMENIFSKKPWIKPVALCSSRTGDVPEQDTTEEVTASQSKRRRQITPVEKKLDELLEASKRRQEDRAKQHAQKMERLDKLLEILQRRED